MKNRSCRLMDLVIIGLILLQAAPDVMRKLVIVNCQ